MASEAMEAAYTQAKASKPKTRVTVYTDTYPDDSKYRKDRRKRLKKELEALEADMKKFDRDKAADKVYGAMLREQLRMKNELDIMALEDD